MENVCFDRFMMYRAPIECAIINNNHDYGYLGESRQDVATAVNLLNTAACAIIIILLIIIY